MAISLPYPYPQLDTEDNKWDSFALLRNLQFLAERIDAVISVNAIAVAIRSVGNPITTVVSTAAETTIFSTTVLGGTFGTNHGLQLVISGDVLNNTGAGRGFILRLKYGGTTFATFDSSGALASNATRRGWQAVTNLSANNSVSNQFSFGECRVSNTGVSGTSVSVASNLQSTHNALAINSAISQTLAVTIQPEVNSASLSIRPFSIAGLLM